MSDSSCGPPLHQCSHMIKSKEEAIQKLLELRLPEVFVQIQHESTSELIKDNCAPPNKFFLQSRAEGHFQYWLPLWEFDGEELYVFDLRQHEYLRYEYSCRKTTTIAQNYQQFLTRLFIDFIYAGLDDFLEELAETFEYKHLEQFRAFVAIPKGDDAEEQYDAFVESITS